MKILFEIEFEGYDDLGYAVIEATDEDEAARLLHMNLHANDPELDDFNEKNGRTVGKIHCIGKAKLPIAYIDNGVRNG